MNLWQIYICLKTILEMSHSTSLNEFKFVWNVKPNLGISNPLGSPFRKHSNTLINPMQNCIGDLFLGLTIEHKSEFQIYKHYITDVIRIPDEIESKPLEPQPINLHNFI